MKSKKIKNALLVVLTLALVSAASIAITFAYVEADLGAKTNTFTSSDNIKVDISEVKWDGETVGTESALPDGTIKGEDLAQSYYEGQEIPKDPKLTNTSTSNENNDEWVAMTVEYTVTIEGTTYTYPSYTAFSNAIAKVKDGTNENTFDSGWVAKDENKTVFYYDSKLAKNAQTTALFDSVKINDSFTKVGNNYSITVYENDTPKSVTTDTLPTFNINLKGYAVQAAGLGDTLNGTIKNALNDLIAGN